MKLKSLLYGSAAVLVSTGATNVAMAADPPVAAEPVEYVRVCDAFGKGFFYIPGSDTCLKIDGYVRIEARINETDDDDDDAYETRARARIRFDARNETDLGLLRSMISIYQTLGPGGNNVSNYDLTYSAGVTLDDAFITLSNDMGQLTVGKTASFFDFFGGYTHTGTGGHDQTTDQTLFAYTFNIGNGVSATLALEDPYSSGRKSAAAFDGTYPSAGNDYFFGAIYGGQQIGDIVANLRVDQGWGSAQIMGALRHIRTKEGSTFTTTTATMSTMNVVTSIAVSTETYNSADEWGWAAGAGLEISIPGMPIDLAAQGCYSEGALAYCVAGTGGPVVDAMTQDQSNGLELSEGWQVGAGASIKASSTISINIDGAYGEIDHPDNLWDYDYWGVAGNVVWKPVSGLAISAEIQYRETNPDASTANAGTCGAAANVSCVSASDAWNGLIRFQRSF